MSEIFENEFENPLVEKTPEEREFEKQVEQKQTIDRIIRGVNDTFTKDYDFKDLGLKFTVKIKAPNAIEIGKVQARMNAERNLRLGLNDVRRR